MCCGAVCIWGVSLGFVLDLFVGTALLCFCCVLFVGAGFCVCCWLWCVFLAVLYFAYCCLCGCCGFCVVCVIGRILCCLVFVGFCFLCCELVVFLWGGCCVAVVFCMLCGCYVVCILCVVGSLCFSGVVLRECHILRVVWL